MSLEEGQSLGDKNTPGGPDKEVIDPRNGEEVG
jgi:hypothetical protein